ncbi:MAG: hypothetical protein ACRD2Z_16220 [Thermoanaerobaculia bacterium]
MTSRRGVEQLDPEALARDLPTTAEDIRALRELRPRIPLQDLADWNRLSAGWQFGLPQRSSTSSGWKPFDL